MKAWYVPSFHGDLRLEPAEDPKHTVLSITDPTAAERQSLAIISGILVDREWLEEAIPEETPDRVTIHASLEEVGPVFVNALKPGPAVITAVRFHDGQVEVVEHRPTGKTGSRSWRSARRRRLP
jgi:hypothetical protein